MSLSLGNFKLPYRLFKKQPSVLKETPSAHGPIRLSTLPHDILLEIAAILSQAPPELPYQDSLMKESHQLLLCYEPSAALSAFSGVSHSCHAASVPYLWQNLRLGTFEHVFDPPVDTSPSAQWTEATYLDRVEEICECAWRVQRAPLAVRRRIKRLRWVGVDITLGRNLLVTLPLLKEIRLVPSYMSLRLVPESTPWASPLSFPNLRYLAIDTSASSFSLLARCPALECLKLFGYPGAAYAFLYTQFEDMCQALKQSGSNKTLRILDFAGSSWSARLYMIAATKLTKLPLEKLEVINMNHSPLCDPPELLSDIIDHLLDYIPTLRAIGLLQVSRGTETELMRLLPSPDNMKRRSLTWEAAFVEYIWPRRPQIAYISFAGQEEDTLRRLWTADMKPGPPSPLSETTFEARLFQETVLWGPRLDGAHPGFPLSIDAAWAEFSD